jgi:glucose/mannose-6-phosphate isomerase
MGGSAIGGDLVAAYAAAACPVPIIVHRDYDLPAWAAGPEVLVIASSHSGNTEETLSSFEAATKAGCRILVVTTGGKLASLAESAGAPVFIFEHKGQPRAAVGYSFGLLLSALCRLGLLPDQDGEVKTAVEAMRRQQEKITASSPVMKNPAKRSAGQLMGRYVSVFGSGMLSPVARRWKGQISEVAKAWAQFEFLPEADHNTLAGTLFPEHMLSMMVALFLHAPSEHPRNTLRAELTRRAFMIDGINTDTIEAAGATPLAHLWTLLQMGDYSAYYLAMAYEVDPTPVDALTNLKQELERNH